MSKTSIKLRNASKNASKNLHIVCKRRNEHSQELDPQWMDQNDESERS